MDQLESDLYDYLDKYHWNLGNVPDSVRRNVNPKLWGSAGWKFIDKIVDGYPVTASRRDKVHMVGFLTSLGHVLPCKTCRENHIKFSKEHPPSRYVHSRKQVRKWLRMYKNKAVK